MFSILIERIWATTVLYLAFAAAVWHLRHVIALPNVAYGLLAISTIYYTYQLTRAVVAEHRLDAIDAKRAPRVRPYEPFGLGTIIRSLHCAAQHRSDEFWWRIFREDGNPKRPYTTECILFGDRVVFTADEENIKAMLATQFQDFGKGPQFRKGWKEFLGLGIFTTDGEMWHNSRSLIRPQFVKDRVSDLHKFETHIRVLLPLLAGAAKGETVRIDDLFYRYTLDAATDFLLGKSVDSLQHDDGGFADAFGEVQRVQAIIERAGPIAPLIPRQSFRRGLKVLNKFVGQYIDQALQLPQEELEKMTKSDEGYTFLHALASYTRDRQFLRDQIVSVLLAGRDTTAMTLSWLFYEISKRPQVVQKLRDEISSFVGWSRQPTYSDLKSMRYLQHTLNETLRLYPVVPYNVRVALQDTTLPFGGGPDGNEPIAIAKDTPVGYSTFIMQRRADIYPSPSTGFPDHLDFVPERWDNWTPKPWTYIPFNGGPRICIGQQFALTEMAYTVVRILQTFERVESRQEGFPMFRSDIVLQPAKGVRVGFFQT